MSVWYMLVSPIHFLLCNRNTGYLKGELKSGLVCPVAWYVDVRICLAKNATLVQTKSVWVFTFSICWVRLSGTSICEGGNSDKKMWICLFTCLAIHAIHMDWVRESIWWAIFAIFKTIHGKARETGDDHFWQRCSIQASENNDWWTVEINSFTWKCC